MVAARRKEEHRPDDGERGWIEFGKFLMLLGMAALFFLLAEDMVHHHFFTGGELNNPQAAVGP